MNNCPAWDDAWDQRLRTTTTLGANLNTAPTGGTPELTRLVNERWVAYVRVLSAEQPYEGLWAGLY